MRKGFRVFAAWGTLTNESRLTKEEAEGPRKDSGVRHVLASLLGWVNASPSTLRSKESDSLVPFCLELGMESPNRSSAKREMIGLIGRERGRSLWEEEGRRQVWVGPSCPRGASLLPPAYPQDCWASQRAGPGHTPALPWSLWIREVWQMDQRSRCHLELAKEDEGDELAKKLGTCLTPFQVSSPFDTGCCCPLKLKGGHSEAL